MRGFPTNKRFFSLVLSLVFLFGAIPIGNSTVLAAEPETIAPYTPYVSNMPTPQNSAIINPNYDRSYDDYVVTGPTGLVHPGILHSRADLNTIRDMVWLGKEPWASAFEKFRRTPESSKEVVIYGNGGTQKEFSYPQISDSSGDKQLRQDATTAYQQALMWYITGDDIYLNNAKKVLDAWGFGLEKFFETTEPANWDTVAQVWGASSVLSSGVAGQKMAAAAEILLYTPSSGWCRDEAGNIDYEKKKIYDNFLRLLWQETNKYYGFFNQAAIGNMGYMSIAIFLDDINGYREAVERFAYNKKAIDTANASGENSTNFSVAAMILDNGQIVEMGRDQPHASGDVGALGAVAQTIFVQGTKFDPETGVPVDEGGVDPYEFQNQKILKAASYFSKYNVGYDVDFIPNVNGLGQKTEWSTVSTSGRGSEEPVIASIYNHYKYVKGYSGGLYDELYKYPEIMMGISYPEGQSIDTPGFGQLLFTPANGASDTEPKGPPQPLEEKGDLYDLYNRHRAVPYSDNNAIFYKNGYVRPGIASYLDENGFVQYKAEGTMNGNWIAYENFDFGSIPADTLAFTYSLNAASGSTISMYVTEPDVKLTDETMAQTTPTAMFQVPNTGWWTIRNTHVQKFENIGDQLIGKKNVYFKFSGSSNVYNFASEAFWFQFSNGFAKTDNNAIDAPYTSSAGYVKNEEARHVTLTDGGYIGYRNMNFDSGTLQLKLNHMAEGSGTLEMRLGGPEGELIKTYGIADTAGSTVTTAIDHEESEVVYGNNGGNNDLYFVYRGNGSLTFNSFKYVTPSTEPAASLKTQGGSYLSDIYDNAEKIGDNVVLRGDNSAVVYRNANMGSRGEDRAFMALRVKSDGPAVVKAIDLYNGNEATSTIAAFSVPDTNGEFVTIAYDLAQSGYGTTGGSRYIKLQATGGTSEGKVEVDYFTFDNNDIEFIDLLENVSIKSDHPNDPSIATAGDTVTLSFAASEPIDHVSVYSGGKLINAITEDQRHFTVSYKLGEIYTPGKIEFRIDYNKEGSFGKSSKSTTDGTSVTIVSEEGLMNDLFKQLPAIDSTPNRSVDATRKQLNYLFDGNAGSFSDFRSDNGGWGAWVAFDLGEEDKVQLNKVKLLARQDLPARAAGIIIQGTNRIGYEPWETLTAPAVNTVNWQTFTVQNEKAFRYIRVYNAGQWFGNLADLKFYGNVIHFGPPVPLDAVSLQSDNSEDPSVAITGNTVTLSFTAGKEIGNVSVYFGSQLMEATSEDQRRWTARYTVGNTYKTGKIDFRILYDTAPIVTGTMDGTSVTVIDPLQVALENANHIAAGDYTRLSYYLFSKQLEIIKAEMNTSGYSETKLAKELYEAKSLLVLSPISLYSFEGNANNSTGASNGTVSGTPVYSEGKVGQAIGLNGTDSYVTLPAAHPSANFDQITMATWVYWNGGNQWQRLFDFGNNTNQYMFLTPRSGSNTMRFAIKNGGGEQSVQTSQLAAGQWVHVAVTLGGGTAKLYVNGEEKASANGITIKPSDFKPSKNYIGKSQFNDPLFNGMVDEFRVYNYVLSAEEIKAVVANTSSSWSDKSLIPFLLEKAAGIDTELYKEESIQALQEVVSHAQSVYNNAGAVQEEIDAASAGLLAALKGLQWKDITATLDPAAPSGKNGWYTSPVTLTLSPAAIAEYSLDGGSTWTAYSAPVILKQEGTHQVLYRRSVEPGETKSLEFKVDLTAPVVQITGETSYTIDQMVSITCRETDVVSSVYGTSCDVPLVSAKAYTLSSGQNTVSVTAEDMASHQTTVTHMFTVTATFDSLKTVTTSFLQTTGAKGWDGIKKSLNFKLDQAKAAVDRGDTAALQDIMASYIDQVTDQTGYSLKSEQADILIRWAQTLI
ncbi:MAG: LamG-like jellyroll fold domain-containing protein [Bacillota bacterium]